MNGGEREMTDTVSETLRESASETPIEELAAKVLARVNEGWRMRLDRPDGLETASIPAHVAQAALAAARAEGAREERERCARIAERMGGCSRCRREIPAAIRDTSHE